MINKKLGYALVASSFIFLWIHILIIFDALYRGIFVLVVADEEEVRRMLLTSPLMDFAGSSDNIIIFILFTFAIGVLLLSVGVYIIKKNRVKV